MIDFNYRNHQFLIRECHTQEIYLEFPKDLLSTEWNGKGGEGAIKIILSRLKWKNDSMIRIINENDLDTLFEIVSTGEDKKDRYLKLVSIVKIDNLHENRIRRDSPHLIC